MRRPALLLLPLMIAGCAVRHQIRSNALEYLYPKGSPAAPPGDVRLQLPVRVGLAFAPPGPQWGEPFTETQKLALLRRVADAFKDREGIAGVEPIPTNFLGQGGGFVELDRLKAGFGIDLMALVSYDQFQFSETSRSSWTYWTLVGAYLVKGEKNETRTVMNSVVYDIPSRTMLFEASGSSSVSGRSTPIDLNKALRVRSEEGFEKATDDLIAHLDAALAAFQQQAKTGTVRGAGTPAIAMVDASGQPVSQAGGGAGSLGGADLAVGLTLALLALSGRGRRRACGLRGPG